MYAQHKTKIETQRDGIAVQQESNYGTVHIRIDSNQFLLAEYAVRENKQTLIGAAIIEAENRSHLMVGKTIELYFDPRYKSSGDDGLVLSKKSVLALRTDKIPVFVTKKGLDRILCSEKCTNNITGLTRFELELV